MRLLIITTAMGRGGRVRWGLILSWIAVIVYTMAIGAPVAAQRGPVDQSGAVVQDGSLGRIYVAQPVANVVLVLSAANMSLLDALTVPAAPAALVMDASRQRLYVASDAAGVISVFDARTDRLLQQRVIGGRPEGLTLSAQGASLIVTDATNGGVLRMPVLPALGTPMPVLSLGVAGPHDVLLAPEATWIGQRSLVWARGFTAGEPVDLYWGVQLLKRVAADKGGFVITKLTVPTGVDLGYHLVILMGQWSTRSESTLLNVVPTPPPPKPVVKRAPRTSIFKTLNRLLTPRLVFKPPALSLGGPLKRLPHLNIHPPAIPAFPFEVLVLLACSVLIVRAGRQRRRRPRQQPKRKPVAKRGKPRAPVRSARQPS